MAFFHHSVQSLICSDAHTCDISEEIDSSFSPSLRRIHHYLRVSAEVTLENKIFNHVRIGLFQNLKVQNNRIDYISSLLYLHSNRKKGRGLFFI